MGEKSVRGRVIIAFIIVCFPWEGKILRAFYFILYVPPYFSNFVP